MKSSRRHESLIPLSREHHYGLMLCLGIRRGLSLHGSDDVWAREKASQVARFFETDLAAHFQAEEESLFPTMKDFAGAADVVSELLADHRTMKRLVERLGGTEGAERLATLSEFADLLDSHIRKEERELFPLYERQVSDEQATEVGRAVKELIGEALQPKEPQLLR